MATLRQMKAMKNRLTILLVLATIASCFFAYTREDIYIFGILGSMLWGAPLVFYVLLVAIRIRWKGVWWPWTQFLVLTLLPILGYARLATSMPDNAVEKEHFRVATYNVNFYSQEDIEEQIEVLEKIDADILSLLEVNKNWEKRLDEYKTAYPFRHKTTDKRANSSVGMSMILSKFPITSSQSVAEGYATQHTIDVVGKKLNLVQVHSLPPLGKALTESRNKTHAQLAELEMGEYKIMLGDFNSVPWQKPLKNIMKSQGFRLASEGALTWPVPLPLAPIDHILTSFNLPYAKSGKVCPMLSDHCLIYSDTNLEQAFNN